MAAACSLNIGAELMRDIVDGLHHIHAGKIWVLVPAHKFVLVEGPGAFQNTLPALACNRQAASAGLPFWGPVCSTRDPTQWSRYYPIKVRAAFINLSSTAYPLTVGIRSMSLSQKLKP